MMIQPRDFFKHLNHRGIGFYTGVPDSLLANFCAYIDDHVHNGQHVIAANEGNAVALAMGYYLSTRCPAVVYMQNSGLGNAINTLVSLADPEVYKVPMLLIIGWRGEPGLEDEPQHVKQGRITLSLLDVLEIPYQVIDSQSQIERVLDETFQHMRERNAPVALVVRNNTFAKYTLSSNHLTTSHLSRENAIKTILQMCGDDLIISTTGKTSRELFELRQANFGSQRDFLTIGGMGHASSIALGVAIGREDRRVVCLDGDGAMLMHMGSLPVIANCKPTNFMHVLFNNGSHESVGGQPTSVNMVDFSGLSYSVGYCGYAKAVSEPQLVDEWERLRTMEGPVLLEVVIKNGSRSDLGRPSLTAEEGKCAFMEAVADE